MKLLIIPCFLALWVACYLPIAAQMLDSVKTDSVQKVRENWYWANTNFGIGTLSAPFIFGGGISISAGFNQSLVTLTTQALLLDWMQGKGNFGYLGAMYGSLQREEDSFSSASVGLAYVAPSGVFELNRGTVGIIGEAQIALKVPIAGVGLKLNAGISPVNGYILGSVVLHLGWMP